MNSPDRIAALMRFTRTLKNNPQFMAYVLDTYQQQEGLTDCDLAEKLGTLPEMLMRLALCRRPDADSQDFANQVREVADYTLTDEAQLASILRQVGILERLSMRFKSRKLDYIESETENTASGLLAAARDRIDSEEPEEPASDDEEEPEE